MPKQYLEAGRIVRTHGLKGEVGIEPWCDSPEFLLQFSELFLDTGARRLKIETVRVHKNAVLVKFEGIDGIEAASQLLRKTIYIDRSLVKMPEGTYFEQDLIGLSVIDFNTGKVYGRLCSVQKTGRNDVYTIETGSGSVLIPAIGDVVKNVDIEGGKMLITPLKGLFDDEN